jgi:TonB family protein
MTAGSLGTANAFQRALIFSALLHAGLIVFIVASPSLSKPPQKGLVQYVSFIGSPGDGGSGGGSGGGTLVPQVLPPPKTKDSLRDLTVPAKAKADEKPGMRHPVDKPKTAKKVPEKKAAITKAQPSTTAPAGAETAAAGSATGQPGGQGPGYGLRFGTGPGGGGGTGGGTGGAAGEPFGVSGFPFTYYLQFLSDKISTSWFTSLVDPGVSGVFQTQVYFKVFRNGQVGDLKVEVSSGVPAFDLSALRAIQTASPFAPLPSEYDGQYLGVHLIFEHSR